MYIYVCPPARIACPGRHLLSLRPGAYAEAYAAYIYMLFWAGPTPRPTPAKCRRKFFPCVFLAFPIYLNNETLIKPTSESKTATKPY